MGHSDTSTFTSVWGGWIPSLMEPRASFLVMRPYFDPSPAGGFCGRLSWGWPSIHPSVPSPLPLLYKVDDSHPWDNYSLRWNGKDRTVLALSTYGTLYYTNVLSVTEGHFTRETESPQLFHSSTVIGGKDGACPSSLRTTLEGPTEYVNARWM